MAFFFIVAAVLNVCHETDPRYELPWSPVTFSGEYGLLLKENIRWKVADLPLVRTKLCERRRLIGAHHFPSS